MAGADIPNAEIARILRDLSDMLEIGGANAFRVRAYRNVARMAEGWPEPIARIAAGGEKALTALPYVGADMAGKVAEIVRTGTLSQYREEAAKVPPGVIELLRVPGLGPRRVQQLRESLGVATLDDLAAAVSAGKVRKVPGFSARLEAQLAQGLETAGRDARRYLRAHVAVYADALLAHMRAAPGARHAEIAGSFRRRCDMVGNLDVVAAGDDPGALVEHFVTYGGVARVESRGAREASVRMNTGLLADLRVVDARAFGTALFWFTGAPAHVEAVVREAAARGLSFDDGGMRRGNERIACEVEEEFYRAVGIPWVSPELREGRGELEAARAGRLPALLELSDIRGDLQMHTTASDGVNTLETMAEAAQALGREYIAFTDHTPALKMIQGLDAEGFRTQWKAIDKVNAKLSTLTVLKGAEVDILQDGSLDMDDATLAELDVVVVSLHSKLSLPPGEQTRRAVRAMCHPNVDIFGHPRGRMLTKREGAQFDIHQVCRAAADHGVMLEVNAQPDRLDLREDDIRVALDYGLNLVLSTDAHSTRDLQFMRWGVDHARRGWLTADRVANARPLAGFLNMMHKRR